jgi:hypothetical protein
MMRKDALSQPMAVFVTEFQGCAVSASYEVANISTGR